MNKVSDIISQRLARAGVKTFFGVQGGACMHLIESTCQNSETQYIPVLNEQAAGLSAHGYYFASGDVAGAIVTTGPGFFNLVTGIAACYYDNVPSVFLCGQVGSGINIAQRLGTKMYGFQEAPHAEIADFISDKSLKVRNEGELLQALSAIDKIAKNEIHGPLVLEIQDDFQRQMLNVDMVESAPKTNANSPAPTIGQSVSTVLSALENAKRPLMLIGGGVDIQTDKVQATLDPILRKLGVPAIFTWAGQRVYRPENPFHIGLFGTHCPGNGNALLQSCDLLIAVGASLLQHQAGKAKDIFAPEAQMIAINNGAHEDERFLHDYGKRITVLREDSMEFLDGLNAHLKTGKQEYAYWTDARPDVSQDKWKTGASQPLQTAISAQEPVKSIIRFLEACPPNYTVFGDAGATLSWTYQAASICNSPPVITSFNLHSMGYSLPAAVGAACSPGCHGALSISGDGGLMMNIQELAVARNLEVPVKFLVIDNQGYGIIRQTQNEFLERRHFGSDIGKSPSLPPYHLRQIFEAFGYETYLSDHNGADDAAAWLFDPKGKYRVAIISVDIDEEVQGTTPNNAPLVS